MSHFPRSLMLCLALLFSVAALNRLAAKPPDLPTDDKVDCKDKSAQQPAGGVLPGIHFGSETGPVDTAVGEESSPAAREENAEDARITLKTLCPWDWSIVRSCWQGVTHCCCGSCTPSGGRDKTAGRKQGGEAAAAPGVEEQEDSPVQPKGAELIPAPALKATQFTCPYLKEQAEKIDSAPRPQAALEQTPLENLRKLAQARALCHEAEKCREEGNLGRACECYQEVQKLCPGSLYEQMATIRLREVQAAQKSGVNGTEEEDKGRSYPQGNEPDTNTRDNASQPSPQDSKKDLKPTIPPIDPKIVDALEQVLSRVGDPAAAKVIIQEQELNPGAGAEEEEEPVSQWPYAPANPELPATLVDPPTIDPSAGAGDEDQDQPEAELSPPLEDVNDLLRTALDALQDGTCTEVDCSKVGEIRMQSELQIGAVSFRIVTDRDSGLQFMVLSLVPETSRDLRAAQRAHNDRISRWIESMNGSAAESTAAEDPAWDEGDDGEDEELQANGESGYTAGSSLRQLPEPHGSVRTARKAVGSVAR